MSCDLPTLRRDRLAALTRRRRPWKQVNGSPAGRHAAARRFEPVDLQKERFSPERFSQANASWAAARCSPCSDECAGAARPPSISQRRTLQTFPGKMVNTLPIDEEKGIPDQESKEESILAMLGIIGTVLNLVVIIFVYIYTTL
ncbi:hypothetical protein EYF80_058981 [Liparis tanakae]|uniref:Uncharacterized protein n=1 Tax=Liparis tanakae TaxID=230148 RepID=A0A4Z2EPN6_9TELE|nr:hypothetical protein EYF80_058981 [Liparis tanakae]